MGVTYHGTASQVRIILTLSLGYINTESGMIMTETPGAGY